MDIIHQLRLFTTTHNRRRKCIDASPSFLPPLLSLMIIICFFLFLGQCGKVTEQQKKQENDFYDLVPSNAINVVEVKRIDVFLQNLDAFSNIFGVLKSSFLGDQSFSDYVKSQLSILLKMEDVGWIDFSKSLGIVLLEATPNLQNPKACLIIPLQTNVPNLDEKLNQLHSFASQTIQDAVTKKVDAFAIISSNNEVDSLIPPKTSFNRKHADVFDSGTVAFYINLKQAFENNPGSLEALQKQLDTIIQTRIKDSAGEQGAHKLEALNNTFFSMIMSGIKQLTALNAAVKLDGQGAALDTQWVFTEKGSIQALNRLFLNEQQASKRESTEQEASIHPIQSMAQYMPNDHLLNLALFAGMDALSTGLNQFALTFNNPETGLTEAEVTQLTAAIQQIMAALGNQCITSLDIDFDASLLQEMGTAIQNNEDFIELLDDFLSDAAINSHAVAWVEQPDVMRGAIKALLDDTSFNKMTASLFHAWGMQLRIELEPLQQLDDLEMDKISCTLNPMDVADPEDLLADDSVLVALMEPVRDVFNKFLVENPMYIHYNHGKMYITVGKQALVNLKAIAEADAYPGDTLADNLHLAAFWNNLPTNCHVLGNLSILRLMQIMEELPNFSIPDLQAQNAPGLIGYLAVEPQCWNTHLFWSYTEIEKLFTALGN